MQISRAVCLDRVARCSEQATLSCCCAFVNQLSSGYISQTVILAPPVVSRMLKVSPNTFPSNSPHLLAPLIEAVVMTPLEML